MADCGICKRRLNDRSDPVRSRDCGGDCLQCMAEAGDPECMETMVKLGIKALKALEAINKKIFATGAPLGSDAYFDIRKECCDVLFKELE